MSTPRRRPLKTVTGVSGAVSTYAAAIDPQQSTVASSIEIAKIAEANKFDALFAADLLSFGAQGAIGAQEPLIFLSALSAVTSHVGLIATVTTTFHHPYNLARLFGTLDHVSNGRAAWNAVTSSTRRGELQRPATCRAPRSATPAPRRSLEVVNALFDSWQPGALTSDGAGRAGRARRRSGAADRPRRQVLHGDGTVEHPAAAAAPSRCRFQAGQSAAGVELGRPVRRGRVHVAAHPRGRRAPTPRASGRGPPNSAAPTGCR